MKLYHDEENADNSAESSEATPEAAKAYQTPQDNVDKSVEPSEGNPEAAKFRALLTIFRFSETVECTPQMCNRNIFQTMLTGLLKSTPPVSQMWDQHSP